MDLPTHDGNFNFYFAYKKSSLIKVCLSNNIANPSRLSREQLIHKLNELVEVFHLPSSDDLLKKYQYLAPLIVHEARKRQKEIQRVDRVRETMIDLIGNSLSRLPCLVAKTNLSSMDIKTIKCNVSALSNLHQFLRTSTICDPGGSVPYDPTYHDGPETLLPGQLCVPISTGIRFGDIILLKALVASCDS